MLLVVKFRKQRKDNHSLVCIVDKVTSFFGLPQQFLITFSYNSEALSGSLAGKESACNAGDPGSILVSGRSSGEGIGYPLQFLGFPCGSAGKESTCNVGDLGSTPGLGRSPGEGNSYPLQSVLAWRIPWTV